MKNLFCCSLVLGCLVLQSGSVWSEDDDKDKKDSKAKAVKSNDDDDDKPTSKSPGPKPKAFVGPNGEKPLGIVKISNAVVQASGISFEPVGPSVISNTVELPGEVGLDLDRTVRLSSKVPGVVSKIYKSAGDTVTAGEAVAEIESTELGSAKIEYFSALSARDLSQAEYVRESQISKHTHELLSGLDQNITPLELDTKVSALSIGDNKTKLIRAYSSLKLASAAWDRTQRLLPNQLISVADSEKVKSEYESAHAELRGIREEVDYGVTQKVYQSERSSKLAESILRNARRKLFSLGVSEDEITSLEQQKESDVNRFVIRAPFTGTILQRNIGLGERKEIGEQSFTLSDRTNAWIRLEIFPRYSGIIKSGLPVMLKVHGLDETFIGKIESVGLQSDEQTRAIPARVVLSNTKGLLKPGQFVDGLVEVEKLQASLAVPELAVCSLGGRKFVFIKTPADGEYAAMPVLTGNSDGKVTEIKSGLVAGQMAVVKNAFVLVAELGKSMTGDND